jgi:Flavin reductase like domain
VSERPTVELRAESLTTGATSRLLTGAIVPRLVRWITTPGDRGGVNLAPFSAFALVSASPQVVGFTVGARKDTCHSVEARGEFLVNIPSFKHLDAVHGSSHARVTSRPFVLELGVRMTVAFDPARAGLYDEDGALVDTAAERTALTVAG